MRLQSSLQIMSLVPLGDKQDEPACLPVCLSARSAGDTEARRDKSAPLVPGPAVLAAKHHLASRPQPAGGLFVVPSDTDGYHWSITSRRRLRLQDSQGCALF